MTYRPSVKRTQKALSELKSRYPLSNFKQIGVGNYGYVYAATVSKTAEIVVKIAYDQHRAFERRVFGIHSALNTRTQPDDRQYYLCTDIENATDEEEDGDRRLVFIFMDKLNGHDMYKYLKVHGKTITLDTTICIIHRLMNAVRVFTRAGVMLSDLKLENVFIHGNAQNPYVTMVDYLDSPTQCSLTSRCVDNSPKTRTYYELFNFKEETLTSDIWRTGIIILDMLYAISKKKGMKPTDYYASDLICDAIDSDHYYGSGNRHRVHVQQECLRKIMETSKRVFCGKVLDGKLLSKTKSFFECLSNIVERLICVDHAGYTVQDACADYLSDPHAKHVLSTHKLAFSGSSSRGMDLLLQQKRSPKSVRKRSRKSGNHPKIALKTASRRLWPSRYKRRRLGSSTPDPL